MYAIQRGFQLKGNERVHVLGPHLRSWREWTDPGKSNVLASGTGSEPMLE